MASNKAARDAQGARGLGRASYIVSTLGIVVTVVVLIIFFEVIYPSLTKVTSSCSYQYDGVCYLYSSSDMILGECLEKGGVYVSYTCYYN